jgi:hypothetical protein
MFIRESDVESRPHGGSVESSGSRWRTRLRRRVAGLCFSALALVGCAGEPEIPRSTVEDYDRAIRLGSEWFLNNQDERFLHYEYYDSEDRYGDGHNQLRELATLWVIAMAANYLEDPRLHELAQRGFTYFETYFERDAQGDFLYVKTPSEPAALGHSAFVILTLLEMEHPRRNEYLEQFANGILRLQEFSGKYRSYFFVDLDANQDYYPGEACLALMLLYEETGEERLLDSVKRAFPYYSKYWEKRRSTAFASWHIQALERLHAATGYERVRRFAFDLADFLIRHHRPQGNCAVFRLGGVFVASRLEGMNSAYKLARDVGDTVRMDCYGKFVREASDYLVYIQFTNTETHAARAIGGFPAWEEPMLRVDRNQHAVAALIEARRLGILE